MSKKKQKKALSKKDKAMIKAMLMESFLKIDFQQIDPRYIDFLIAVFIQLNTQNHTDISTGSV